MLASSDPQSAAIALNRFGLGARPDEALPADPKPWLLAQFDRYQAASPAWSGQPQCAALVREFAQARRELRRADAENAKAMRRDLRERTVARYRSAVNARVASALTTPAPFAERLVHFWSNHFAVSAEKVPLAMLAGAYEFEAIRPNVVGRFVDMLLAVERHPAMLLYLDQFRSIGPDSAVARRAERANPERPRGLNENLAREILELHTLGVRTGYGQEDVTEFARALTGWSIAGIAGRRSDASPGSFAFQPALHEPGSRRVLGRRYDQPGEAQAEAILRDIAAAPATAQHIATKLARHFVSDAPPPALIARLADAFQRSGGDLPTVYRALVESAESWQPTPAKFKSPWEWAVSALRGLGLRELRDRPLAPVLLQLGQPVWRPGSPAGYDDSSETWMAPDALMRRVDLAQRLAGRFAGSVDARMLSRQLLPAGVSDGTATAIARADSATTALTLLLVSPEFLRR